MGVFFVGDVSKLVNEYVLLLVLCSTKFYTYIVRAVRVINAFCDFLGIRCLVIPTTKQSDRTIVPKTSGMIIEKDFIHKHILMSFFLFYLAEHETESLLVAQEEGTSQQQQYNTF